ncbi:MAG TPA: 4-vinyl reductase, partial [Burkholderiales bacterium]|nr:4-vinyl reductase [Burkholderiales bacterium]
SQRGWGQFRVESVDAQAGRARVRVQHSVFATQKGEKACYMFRGWFPGALEFVAQSGVRLTSSELQCAAEGHDHCLFEIAPA